MTKQWREQPVSCHRCGHRVDTEPPIKAWIRTHEYLDAWEKALWIGDTDLWVHKWGQRSTRHRGVSRDVQYLMMVEVKTHWKDVDEPQRDSLWAIDRLLRTKAWKDQRLSGLFAAGHAQNARVVHGRIAGKAVWLYCYGVHKLRLSGSTPEDSERITWDDKPIDKGRLLDLLAFEISPDNFNRIEHRAHKEIRRDEPLPFEQPQIEGW